MFFPLRLRLDPEVPLLATTDVTTATRLDPCMVAGECGGKQKVERIVYLRKEEEKVAL